MDTNLLCRTRRAQERVQVESAAGGGDRGHRNIRPEGGGGRRTHLRHRPALHRGAGHWLQLFMSDTRKSENGSMSDIKKEGKFFMSDTKKGEKLSMSDTMK